jgi:hypothetical protein
LPCAQAAAYGLNTNTFVLDQALSVLICKVTKSDVRKAVKKTSPEITHLIKKSNKIRCQSTKQMHGSAIDLRSKVTLQVWFFREKIRGL